MGWINLSYYTNKHAKIKMNQAKIKFVHLFSIFFVIFRLYKILLQFQHYHFNGRGSVQEIAHCKFYINTFIRRNLYLVSGVYKTFALRIQYKKVTANRSSLYAMCQQSTTVLINWTDHSFRRNLWNQNLRIHPSIVHPNMECDRTMANLYKRFLFYWRRISIRLEKHITYKQILKCHFLLLHILDRQIQLLCSPVDQNHQNYFASKAEAVPNQCSVDKELHPKNV